MKNHKILSAWTWVRIPILLAILVCVFLWLKSCHNTRMEYIANTYKLQADSIVYFKDKFNQEHAQRLAVDKGYNELKNTREALALKRKAAELGVKPRNIQSTTTIVLDRRINLDSLRREWMMQNPLPEQSITWPIYRVPEEEVDTMLPNIISWSDSLSVTQYKRKTGWFSSMPMVDVTVYNPYTSVKKVESIRIKSYQNNLTFGPNISATFINGRIQPVFGIGIQYPILGVRIGKQR